MTLGSCTDAKTAGEKVHYFTQNSILILEYIIPFENYHEQKNGFIHTCPVCNFEISCFEKISTVGINTKR
jgi:hypothetical protein